MENILDKLSSYNFFTNLFPGILYCYLADSLFGLQLLQGDLLVGVFTYYFVGMVISRVGSLIVEELIKKGGLVEYVDHSSSIAAEKADPKLQTLLETNNGYRSVISLLFCLFITGIWTFLLSTSAWFERLSPWLILGGLLVLFIFAFRKQTSYIVGRVNQHTQSVKSESKSNGS
ncbi:MAG: hypothetical protein DRR42_01645 [Gammaproteobacteria bacterium]|nr:MAG: hypothetical protein DRR42_01645 [Gammaproteobacteria bacterium]